MARDMPMKNIRYIGLFSADEGSKIFCHHIGGRRIISHDGGTVIWSGRGFVFFSLQVIQVDGVPHPQDRHYIGARAEPLQQVCGTAFPEANKLNVRPAVIPVKYNGISVCTLGYF